MKIQIASDLHREFMPTGIQLIDTGADVLVLAGDIDFGTRGLLWGKNSAYKCAIPTLYVPGNHEYYGEEYHSHLEEMREMAERWGIVLLERDAVEIDGVRFLGTTLWTDYRADPATSQQDSMAVCGRSITDHWKIAIEEGGQRRRFSPEDALALHLESRAWLAAHLAQPYAGRTVIVTHHGPSRACQHPKFPVGPVSGAFQSDLDALFDPKKVQMWIYGHTHACIDTQVNGVRLVSNQYGYEGRELVQGYDPAKVIELDTEHGAR